VADAAVGPLASGDMWAIRAARLFDGFSIVPTGVVIIDGGRIAGLEMAVPPGLDVVDLGDVTLLPGLVDAHTHLVFDAGDNAVGRLDTVDDEALLDGARIAALTALDAGITTVRDLGDRGYATLRLRDEFAAEPGSGPEILAAGPPITTPRGHCWFFGGEARGVDGVRAAVRERVERGADVIKVMASGGEITPGSRPWDVQFGLEELRAAVTEAHRLGLPITAHAHGAPAVSNVAAAGFDSLEHCSFRTPDGAQADPVIIDALVQAGVTVSATLGHLPDLPVPPDVAALIPQLSRVFHQIRASGAKIVCSSDAGINRAKPHDVLPWGVGEMVELLGYSTVEALRSSTSTAASTCGVGKRKGRIAVGYDADLLAVYGDPVADVSALRSVAAVFRAGHRIR
jgi:imidazolonepropionase-like amidohydrolase